MKKQAKVLSLGLILGLGLTVFATSISAFASNNDSLKLTKIKISTSGQFLEISNDSDQSIDMSRVQIAYYNHYDFVKSTSSKLISLTGVLLPNEKYIINDTALMMCYQATVYSSSLGFSTTNGMVQLIYLEQNEIGGQFRSTVLDSVAWSKSSAPSQNVIPVPASGTKNFMMRLNNTWNEVWPSEADNCQIEMSEGTVEQSENDEFTFLGRVTPPVRRLAKSSSTTSKSKANRNAGKMAPIINELLPNPASPQSDAEDEFIELYNPNKVDFDLTGFKLAFGSKNPKKYTFPEGTILRPNEFKAFTSGDTSISLSNTQAKVWLLDPNEKVVDETEAYFTAKDGIAWALDNNKWVWTNTPTPNAINNISTQAEKSKAKNASAVLGINKNSNNGSGVSGEGLNGKQLADATPVNPFILVTIGLAAIGYAIYEYRSDISNKVFEARRYFRNRQEARKSL